VLLCIHFARNLAYYRAGHNRVAKSGSQFWATVDGNFLDTAVLEWCKLLGDNRGKHYWGNVVSDKGEFKRELLRHLDIKEDEFAEYVDQVRTYRDKFLAHLDDRETMDIPFMNRAKASVEFYHDHIMESEPEEFDLRGLPTDLKKYYRQCTAEANSVFSLAFEHDR
jgi:hypothetical protein